MWCLAWWNARYSMRPQWKKGWREKPCKQQDLVFQLPLFMWTCSMRIVCTSYVHVVLRLIKCKVQQDKQYWRQSFWGSFGYALCQLDQHDCKKVCNRASTQSTWASTKCFKKDRRRQTKLLLANATSGNRITSGTASVEEVIQVPWCCFQENGVKKKKGLTDLNRCKLNEASERVE